ncbi:MFS transporter [Pseudomonas cremoricolorata]|uniref:MFS transporter n=1 Tax=Pseudomonas cremoricolorata TaxID=157783 RepID=UPI000428539C|nr:MFS transporter [Pseudomonas cremoricolorata]
MTSTPPSRALILLMAIAVGLSVASNYYAQPLLHSIAEQFGLTTVSAGSIVITAQLSYGAGLLLLAPLGDLFEQRRLVVSMIGIATLGLVISACAPSLAWLIVGTALTGLFSVVAQVLVPMAAALSDPAQRGRTVGTLMSGLLLGILLARTAAGLAAELGGWRTIYVIAAGLMMIIAVTLQRCLPRHHSPAGLSYPALIGSVFRLFIEEPVLRLRSLLGMLAFCLFALFWTPLAFLLAREPYQYSDAVIGLFGLAGAAGALSATWAGRLADRGKGGLGTTVGLVVLLLSWIPLGFAHTSLVALIVGVLLLDLAVQLVHVGNQNAVLALRPEARTRLNAGYITCYFIGGAAGSWLGSQLFQWRGWEAIVFAGLLLGALALGVWWLAVGRARAARPAL